MTIEQLKERHTYCRSIFMGHCLMSRTSMSHEFSECAKAFGWTVAEFRELTLNAMNAAFIDDKSEYLKRIGAGYDQL